MPLGEKLQRPFELLSLRGRKKKGEAPPVAARTAYAPPPPPSSSYAGTQVQYERITASSPAPAVTYEPLTAATAVAAPSPVPSASASSKHMITHVPRQKPVPLVYDAAARAAAFPSPDATVAAPPPVLPSATFRSPGISSLPSPGMLTPITPGDVGRSPGLDLPPLGRPPVSSAAQVQAGIKPDVAAAVPPTAPVSAPSPVQMGTPGVSGTSSFSSVMGEWMSQLRTPTPDVTLLPSPYDFNQDTPTPVERAEDLMRLQDALLPTPPPDVHDQKQHPKSSEYILSAGTGSRRPLLEDIASLCRDLNSQDINDHLPYAGKRGPATPLVPAAHVADRSLPSVHQLRGIETKYDGRGRYESVDYADYDDEDKMSVSSYQGGGSTPASAGGPKGKRRKMCTAEGCTNLSRSRGLCKAHGGGRRCSVDGCTRASQSGSLCITHGGGKRCTVDGCMKAAQSRGMCKAHGGGVRCRVDGCTKSSQGDGFCRSHGGGRRCGHPSGCTKWAQRNGMCMAHSEGKYGNSYRGRLHRMQEQVRPGQQQHWAS